MAIVIFNPDVSLASELLSSLKTAFPDCRWKSTERHQDSDLCILLPGQDFRTTAPTINVQSSDSAHLQIEINGGIREGLLVLPTTLGVEMLSARIKDELTKLKKLRDNNPLFLPDDRIIGEELIDGQIKICAHLLHPPAVKRYTPDLENILHSRAVRNLQRVVDNWLPMGPPLGLDDEIIALYPKVPQSAEELRERLHGISKTLEDLGIVISKSVMDKSQLNVGIPFAGGHNRLNQGLTSPSDNYDRIASTIANVMVRGAARTYSEIGHEAFLQENTRVGVKVNNYQGALLNTYSHSVRQTLWEIMKRNGNDIFYFSDLNVPTVSGFRSQDNGAGKRRASYVLIAPGVVARTRVLDGDDLEGKSVMKFESTTDSGHTIIDEGWIGARKRIVGNVWSGQNDSIVPVPAYIAKYKDYHYKALYQQDKEILSRFISGSDEFDRFWTEGYENMSWVREAAKARGAHSLPEFIQLINSIGEFVICGDVVSFDGNASWEIVYPFFSKLLSTEALAVTKKLWDSDKIGVYTDVKGEISYYYVKCNEGDDELSEEELALVEETSSLMSSLPSGIGPTAQAGRGIVPTALVEIVYDEFGKEIPNFWEVLESLPNDPEHQFSFLTALMNSAGDDHNLGSLVLWLLTGVHPKDVTVRLEEAFTKYTTLLIEPEYPKKMNAGWLFHEGEDGRLIDITLSDSRMFANTIYPEYRRSAVGLYHSVNNYVNSAIGSPIEEKMHQLSELIVKDVYGFESLTHLEQLAYAEELFLMSQADNASAQETIAAQLGIPQNDLEWKYSFDDLINLGIDEELLESFRKPIPQELTVNPFKFLNSELIIEIATKEFA